MESGAKGCEVIVSGKLRGQRAKSMKFVDGFMIHSGNPTRDYIDSAVTHVLLRQGMTTYFSSFFWFYKLITFHSDTAKSITVIAAYVFITCSLPPFHSGLCSCVHVGVLGIKVKIMLPHDPTGKQGPKKPLPDQVPARNKLPSLLTRSTATL